MVGPPVVGVLALMLGAGVLQAQDPATAATSGARLDHVTGALMFCGPVPPPDLRGVSRDASGVAHATLAAPDLRERGDRERVALWLVYPGFQAFPSALGVFRTEVTTPAGRLTLCLVVDTETVEATSGRTGADPVKGALAHLSYDPSVTGVPHYPFDPAFDDARTRKLLTEVQASQLAALDRVVAERGGLLARDWDEFRQSPYVIESRRRLLDALHAVYDPRPAFEPGALEPAHFFNRAQREALRRLGHRIPGRCFIDLRAAKALLELRSCPLEQLAGTWNRLVADGTVRAPTVHVTSGAGAREVAVASFSAEELSADEGSRLLFALVTSFGLEAEAPASLRR